MFTGTQIIDCGGLDLTKASSASQTISGLYNKLDAALKKDVNVILNNCVYGTGKATSPFNVVVYRASATSIVAFVSTIKITISNADAVTIGSMS